MNGQLQQNIIRLFKERFENDCISLLLEGYNSLRNSGRQINDYSENNITAQLYGCMKSNPRRADFQIHIERENYLDNEDTYAGLTDADKSPRIDIKYSAWHSKTEYEYHMEAKNLIENNWKRDAAGSYINANSLQKRYIETGIGNFVSGRYPNGCLLGYILEGDIPKIAQLLNEMLKWDNREKEALLKHNGYEFDSFYISKHNSTLPTLKHFFLNFS